MNIALKPCPFCGTHSDGVRAYNRTCDKTSRYDPADRAFPIVRCLGCGACAEGNDWAGIETAISKWNMRAGEAK